MGGFSSWLVLELPPLVLIPYEATSQRAEERVLASSDPRAPSRGKRTDAVF